MTAGGPVMHDDNPKLPTGGWMSGPPEALDDPALAGLVRDAAERWVAPPQRLGAPTWRDLVSARGSGKRAGIHWWRRAGGALAAAVTLTVALALVAVWLMTPRGHAPAIG